MFFRIYKPAPELSSFVSSYIIFEDDGVLNKQPLNIVSNGLPEIAIHFGDDCTSYINYPGEVKTGYIYGPQTKTGFFRSHGSIKCLCILFHPLGAYRIFGYPQSEYRNYAVNLDLLCNNDAIDFIGKITLAVSHNERVRIADKFLLARLKRSGEKNISMADHAIGMLEKSNGRIRIQELCRIFGLSIKTLERRVKDIMGLTPKEFISAVRVNRAFSLMKTKPGMDIQDIVYECGYYDQSHFINDFRRHTMYTPRNYQKGP